VDKFFSPEFRNRLDATIHFKPLNKKLIEHIVDKFIKEVSVLLKQRKVTIILRPGARSWIAKKGYDPKNGARPISRLIEREIHEKLVDEILFGKLEHGGKATISVKHDKLIFQIS